MSDRRRKGVRTTRDRRHRLARRDDSDIREVAAPEHAFVTRREDVAANGELLSGHEDELLRGALAND